MNFTKLKQQKSINELLEFGIINFDKPADWTSFDVVNYVKKKLGLRKASHFGTLDPMVTGVLPIALNRACKLTGFFIGEDKEYEGIMRIHKDISLEKIKEKIKEKFIGKIIQMPPVKSSVKRQLRDREIYGFELLEKKGKNISFHVECQGGTYIRKLIHDLGEELGIGAHMTELRRIRAGIFAIGHRHRQNAIKNCNDTLLTHAITKEEFDKAIAHRHRDELEENENKGNEKILKEIIIPAEIISEVYPVVKIKEKNLKKIFTGKPIHREDLVNEEKFERENIICVFCKEKFIGMYKVINGEEIFARAEFVMQEIK